jgi:hypothetical protein
MAKVIEFYVPKNFRKPLRWAPQLQCGKVIEFCSQTKKSAQLGQGFKLIQETANEADWIWLTRGGPIWGFAAGHSLALPGLCGLDSRQ